MQDSTAKSPHPGTYEGVPFAAASLGQPRYGFGSQKRMMTISGRQPGPGSYEISTTIGSRSGVPVYSMPGRRKDLRPKSGEGVPGANVYYPRNTLTAQTAPQFSVSRNPKDKEVALFPHTPGCGTYFTDASINMTKTHSASWR